MFEIFNPGDHIIAEADLYGGSIRLFDNVSRKNGYDFTFLNCAGEDIEKYIKENTKAIYLETPTNPMMNVSDIVAVAKIAKKHNLILIVDNTFLSPYFQNPLKLGADVVIHSGTKFLGGHNDTLAGFIVSDNEAVIEKLRFLIKTTGAGLAPFDSWLMLRGIKTLGVRMERAEKNALEIAKAKYLIFDLLFLKPNLNDIEGDKKFIRQIKNNNNIYLSMLYTSATSTTNFSKSSSF